MTVAAANRILSAAVAAINAALPAVPVFRSRPIAFQREDLPAIVILPDTDDSKRFSARQITVSLHFEVRFYLRGDDWETTVAPLDQAVHQALTISRAMESCTSEVTRTGTRWITDNADGTAGELIVRYTAIYDEAG